jgi:hypothetical protein
MRRRRATLGGQWTAALVVGILLGGCGGGDDPPPTTTVTEPATTLTTVTTVPQGVACLNLATEALRLLNDFRQASRGIVAPDPEPYRQEAEALRAEHARLGCPGELLKGFPDG